MLCQTSPGAPLVQLALNAWHHCRDHRPTWVLDQRLFWTIEVCPFLQHVLGDQEAQKAVCSWVWLCAHDCPSQRLAAPVCHCLTLYSWARSASLKTGALSSSLDTSSMNATSSAKATPCRRLSSSPVLSWEVACLALLYNVLRQFVW